MQKEKCWFNFSLLYNSLHPVIWSCYLQVNIWFWFRKNLSIWQISQNKFIFLIRSFSTFNSNNHWIKSFLSHFSLVLCHKTRPFYTVHWPLSSLLGALHDWVMNHLVKAWKCLSYMQMGSTFLFIMFSKHITFKMSLSSLYLTIHIRSAVPCWR